MKLQAEIKCNKSLQATFMRFYIQEKYLMR